MKNAVLPGLMMALALPAAGLALDLNRAAPPPASADPAAVVPALPPVTVQPLEQAAPTLQSQTAPASPAAATGPTGQFTSPVPVAPVLPVTPAPKPQPVVAPPPPVALPAPVPVAPGADPRMESLARIQAKLGRPFSDPERRAVLDAGKAETSELRIAHSDYADRAAAATRIYRGRVIEFLPPLAGFATQPTINLQPAIEKERGLPLTAEEKQVLATLEADRRRSIAAIRQRYVAQVAGRTGLSIPQVSDALAGR